MERYSQLLQQHDRLIMNPRLAESLRPHYASLYERSRDRSRRRRVEKGKRASHRPRLYFDTRVLTYVSLTLAKTPHLPIKRRKVIHIGQPRDRVTGEKEGYARRSHSTYRGFLRLHVRLVVTWRNVDAFRELFFLAP